MAEAFCDRIILQTDGLKVLSDPAGTEKRLYFWKFNPQDKYTRGTRMLLAGCI